MCLHYCCCSPNISAGAHYMLWSLLLSLLLQTRTAHERAEVWPT
jgi:hypothetical protein